MTTVREIVDMTTVRESVDMTTVREKCSRVRFNLRRPKINSDCLFLY